MCTRGHQRQRLFAAPHSATPPAPAGAASTPCTMPARERGREEVVSGKRGRWRTQAQARYRKSRQPAVPCSCTSCAAPVTPATMPQSTTRVCPCVKQGGKEGRAGTAGGRLCRAAASGSERLPRAASRGGGGGRGASAAARGPLQEPSPSASAAAHVDGAAHVRREVQKGVGDVSRHNGLPPQRAHLRQRRLHVCG